MVNVKVMRCWSATLTGVGFVGAVSSAAFAADVIAPVPPVVTPPPAVQQALGGDWQGLYFGAHADFGLSNLKFEINEDDFSFDGVGGRGFWGGLLAGYDLRLGQRWVGGVEIDGSVGGGGPTLEASDDDDFVSAWIDTDWTASAKVRLGYLTSPDTLLYMSVGGTIAHANYGYEIFIDPDSDADEVDDTLYGLVLAAIGAETRVSPNVRFRYEYLTSFLQPQSFDIGGDELVVTPLTGTARVAAIVDIGDTGQDGGFAGFGYAPDTWTGVHVGGAVGHSMAVTRYGFEEDPVAISFDGFGGDGFVGGVFGGFDVQVGPSLVLGIDGGYYWTNVRTEAEYGGGVGMAYVSHDTFYDARVRVGYVANPSTMIYGLVGWARVNGSVYAGDDVDVYADESFDRDGVEFGGGIETWVTENLTIRAEYTRTIFNDEVDLLPPEFGHLTTHVGNATLAAVFHLG